ncbi:sulfotransferase [Okeania hirsuta]|uniref:sulfotransferase n=1 Tax=Okeania hirsuta TaxID=1458930 RepID=UPI000F530503|nr:sulfotransferase [Okeania hirsuta]RQH17858.1 hypothetical protein D4Z78_16625 [Okeania hirsuta]
MKTNTENLSSTTPPIFILCCERSGSSLLRYILDTHPDIASPAELNLAKLCRSLYVFIESTMGQISSWSEESQKKHAIAEEVRQIIFSVMTKYAKSKNKLMWCEKSPSNIDNVAWLETVFPDSKYICLHRHAMDVVQSCLEATKYSFMPEQLSYVCRNSGNIVGAMLENWIVKTKALLEFEKKHKTQCFRIKYESYVLNPGLSLGTMFEFLNVSWDESLLEKVFSVQHDGGFEDQKLQFSQSIHSRSIGKGATIKRRFIPNDLLGQMNELLAELDYPIVDTNWDSVLSLDNQLNSDSTLETLTSTLEDIFTQIFPPRLQELKEALERNPVIYQIIVVGKNAGIWTIDLTKPKNQISKEKAERNADCVARVSAKDLVELVNGNTNPVELQMQEKLQITGDAKLAEIFCLFLVGRLQSYQSSVSCWWQRHSTDIEESHKSAL